MFEIGSSLREARLRQGVEFPELEQATKIRGKYLRALEEEQFDVLPAQTYVKGFLRNYADQLGLDGQLYVDEYNSRYVVGEEDELDVNVRPRRSSVRAPMDTRLTKRAVAIALAAIALVFALVIGAWKFGGSNAPPLAPASLHPKPSKQTPVTPVRRHPQAAPAVLVLRAVRGRCWLRVNRGSSAGPQVYEGTLELGQSVRFVAPRLVLRLGAPSSVSARLNGRIVALPGSLPVYVLVTAHGLREAPPGA